MDVQRDDAPLWNTGGCRKNDASRLLKFDHPTSINNTLIMYIEFWLLTIRSAFSLLLVHNAFEKPPWGSYRSAYVFSIRAALHHGVQQGVLNLLVLSAWHAGRQGLEEWDKMVVRGFQIRHKDGHAWSRRRNKHTSATMRTQTCLDHNCPLVTREDITPSSIPTVSNVLHL